jgi:outer membrane immunogenic protein
MKRLILAGISVLALAAAVSAANAADLGRRGMPAKAPAYVEPVYNWTGFYAGINGGWGFGSSEWSAATATHSFDIDGGLVGGTVGYNYQMGLWVLGLEGDIDWSDIRGSAVNAPCLGVSCETRNSWLATARGRIGYSFGRFMPYVTAGGAFGDVKMNPIGLASQTDTRAGWTAGGGVEFALTGPWTAKVEYLYVDLGNETCNAANCGIATSVDFTSNIVRAGLNYRF